MKNTAICPHCNEELDLNAPVKCKSCGHRYLYKALSRTVLVVASISNPEWAAYVDSVPGKSHDLEMLEVSRNDSKLDPMIAKFLFPNLAAKYRWRA